MNIPAINTSIQIVSIKQGVVRIGIDAPEEVVVLREEILANKEVEFGSALKNLLESQVLPAHTRHEIRNRLNTVTVGFALLRRQIQAGQQQDALLTLQKLEEEFSGIKQFNEGDTTPPRRANCTALLVEDDRNERELLAGFLRMAGMQVATAGDGADALDYLKDHSVPDVILIDMMMPHRDGASTIAEIRSNINFDQMKIFAMTGHSRDNFELDPKSRIDHWFAKPLDPQQLLRDVKQAVHAE